MTTRKNILAAMVGLAMLAMPVRALAGDHHHRDWDDNPRPQAWHDQGNHNGWFKNHGDRDDYRPGWNGRNYYQPPVWHHEPDRDDYRYYQPVRHHEPDADDYSCDADGDDCRPVGSGNYGGSYGAPYYGKSLEQLMVDRQNEYRTYISLLNRHDSRAANRYRQKVLNPTDQRIAALNRGYVPPSPGFLGGPVNWGNGNYNAYPYGSGYNNGYYGNNGNNPMGGLGALVGPLLGVTP
jgi:hypothetical protein